MSFNIHKGLSPFWRKRTLPIVKKIIQQNEVDFVCLQEIGSRNVPEHENLKFQTQLDFLAHLSWPHMCYGKNSVYSSGHHGNAILSHYPIVSYENKDLSLNRMEKRGLLRAQIAISPQRCIEISTTHLNLRNKDRNLQAHTIAQQFQQRMQKNPYQILAGDFNDWNQELDSIFKHQASLTEAFFHLTRKSARSFPSVLPVLPLDRIYFSKSLQPLQAQVIRSLETTITSDHLPLIFDFSLPET